MEKFNTDLRQVLKWMHNKAPQIQSLVDQKAEWYEKYNSKFWSNWERDVFNIDTVNEFGVYVWCEILGIPKENFVFEPLTQAWAYGEERQNYKYSGTDTTIPVADRNTVGGNFFGAGRDVVTGLEEARLILKLRYMTLVSGGKVAEINRMLKWILNGNEEWDLTAKKYAYLIDNTSVPANPSINLNIRMTDWQGDNQMSSTVARDQIGNNNVSMGLRANWSFTGNSVSSPYVGGDSQLYTAPDGTLSAVNLLYTSANTNAQYVAASASRFMPSTKSADYTISFFVKPVAGATGLKKILIPGPSSIQAGGQWFSAQNAMFDFSADGDPVITVSAILAGSTAITMDKTRVGFKKYANGWYRIWNTCVTSRNLVQSTAGYIWQSMTFQDAAPTGKSIQVWGAMLTDHPSQTIPVEPDFFWYTTNTAPTRKTMIDYSINQTNKTITFATLANSKSLVGDGAKIYGSDDYMGFPVETPYLIATGDGLTTTFNIPVPPSYQAPFSTPLKMEYRIGRGFTFTAQFINLISDRSIGILPSNAGIAYDVVY